MVKRSFVHDGLVREFWTYLPSRTGSRLPMVMALHGYTGTAQGFEAWTHMNAHAEQHGYVVVYPQSTGFMGVYPGRGEMLITSWNDLSSSPPTGPEGESCVLEERTYPCPPECSACGTCNWGSCHDDLGFLERIIDYSIASACVAPSRVYATEFSNGGMMSQQVGCSLSDRFAAVAPSPGFCIRDSAARLLRQPH